MSSTFSRSLISISIAAIASVGLLAGCEQKTTTRTPDGSSTTTTTVTNPAPEATAAMKSAAGAVKERLRPEDQQRLADEYLAGLGKAGAALRGRA